MEAEDFVLSVVSCVNIDMDWPAINLPGFPSLCFGCFGSMFAGINLILPFIPPDIDNLPDFTLPDINIFIDAFFLGNIGIPSFPAISIPFPDITINLPAYSGFDLPDMPDFDWGFSLGFDPLSMCKLISLFIALPYLIIKFILDSIFDLSLQIPDFDFIYDLIISLGFDLDFPLPSLELFASCLAIAIVALLVEMIG